jgi:hypothetical protein
MRIGIFAEDDGDLFPMICFLLPEKDVRKREKKDLNIC